MDTATLVEDEIAVGQELLDALELQKMDVRAMLWLYFPDEGEYRLLVATPMVLFDGDTAMYAKIGKVLQHLQLLSRLPLRKIAVVPTQHRLIIGLRRMKIRVRPGDPGVRITNNAIGGIIIHDAYIFRML